MKKLFLIGSIAAIAAGALAIIITPMVISFDDLYVIFMSIGGVVAFIGLLLLITGNTAPVVARSKNGFIVGILLIVGSALVIAGPFAGEDIGPPVAIGGVIVALISMFMWACFCSQGKGSVRTKILGIASGHESISVSEIGSEAEIEEEMVKEILYDALGKKEIYGRIEGETFIRTAPPTTTYTAPAAAGTVKVLVICPYCGAKTEQGLTKCQKCSADL